MLRPKKSISLFAEYYKSPIGGLILCASNKEIYAIEFTDKKNFKKNIVELSKLLKYDIIIRKNKLINNLIKELDNYFSGKLIRFKTPLHYEGTKFQHNVWNILRKIPYGKTISYKDLAEKVKNSKAVRAVGLANKANPIAILIPCHRVINHNGLIGGYNGGVWRKEYLLKLEKFFNKLKE
jgi:O-6-methylguanine DNA methyltransferase